MIQVSIKKCRRRHEASAMRQTQSLVTTYYLNIPFDDMKFKLILAILFDK